MNARKASELIADLAQLITQHGDLPVFGLWDDNIHGRINLVHRPAEIREHLPGRTTWGHTEERIQIE